MRGEWVINDGRIRTLSDGVPSYSIVSEFTLDEIRDLVEFVNGLLRVCVRNLSDWIIARLHSPVFEDVITNGNASYCRIRVDSLFP